MPINFKDYTAIPWRAPTTLGGTGNKEPQPLTVSNNLPPPPLHPHHHRLKKLFHLSHKLHLKFL